MQTPMLQSARLIQPLLDYLMKPLGPAGSCTALSNDLSMTGWQLSIRRSEVLV